MDYEEKCANINFEWITIMNDLSKQNHLKVKEKVEYIPSELYEFLLDLDEAKFNGNFKEKSIDEIAHIIPPVYSSYGSYAELEEYYPGKLSSEIMVYLALGIILIFGNSEKKLNINDNDKITCYNFIFGKESDLEYIVKNSDEFKEKIDIIFSNLSGINLMNLKKKNIDDWGQACSKIKVKIMEKLENLILERSKNV